MKNRKSSQSDTPQERIFIGVAGGSAAGKTTLCETINRQMAFDRNFKVQTISLDSFYKSIDKTQVDVADYNFDHPLALDFDLAYEVLTTLKHTNEPVAVPQYSFVEHKRLSEPTYVNPANIILFEGLMAFHDERIRSMMTYKIFINCDDDIRLCRRIKRDVAERGRTIVGVLAQYNKFVKNAFRDFIYPTIAYADIVIPGHRNNRISVDFIVQHIKNMAKKINIFEKAAKTRVFLFGENQYYDRNVSKDYNASVGCIQESFLIFPTSEEHKRQIDFFMSSLMSEAFTEDYFEEVYIYQFMKIVRALLRQLFELKSYKPENVELISYFEVREKLTRPSQKNIKIIFIPFILSKYVEGILSVIKSLLKPHFTVIIVNLFCEMQFPKLVYNSEIQGIIFLNLLLIANKRRLLQVLTSNNINNNSSKSYDWLFSNPDLVRRGMKFVSSELQVEYNPLCWEDFEELLNQKPENIQSEESGFKKKEKIVPLVTHPIRQDTVWNEDNKGPVKQICVLEQKNQNLCGFHALHCIREYPNVDNIRSQQKFLENFKQFTEALVRDEVTNWLKKPMCNPLEREDAIHLAGHETLFGKKQISTLFISENYITSHFRDLQKLSQKCDLVKNGVLEELFIIMGVYNHFFVVRMSNQDGKTLVEYFDSINTPIEDIMADKVSVPDPQPEDYRKAKNLKTAMKVVRELLYTETKIQTILVQLRIDEIIGSYYQAAKENGLKQWLIDEYPAPVIRNDLLLEIQKTNPKDLGPEYLEKVKIWLKEQFVLRNIIRQEEAEEILNHLSS